MSQLSEKKSFSHQCLIGVKKYMLNLKRSDVNTYFIEIAHVALYNSYLILMPMIALFLLFGNLFFFFSKGPGKKGEEIHV